MNKGGVEYTSDKGQTNNFSNSACFGIVNLETRLTARFEQVQKCHSI